MKKLWSCNWVPILVWVVGSFLPLLVLIIFSGRDWLYDQPGWLDAYIYTGYGYNYPSHDFVPGYYKIARLPWILVQSLCHRLLPHELVISFLAIVMLIMISFVWFMLVYKLTRHLTAAVISENALSLLPLIYIFNGGWSYHEVPGTLLFLAGLYFLPLKSTELSRGRSILSFMFFSLAFYVKNTVLFAFPGLLLLCLIPCFSVENSGLKQKFINSIAPLKKLFIYALLSFAGVTVFLCLIHRILYKEWLFFLPVLQMGLGTGKGLERMPENFVPLFYKVSQGYYFIPVMMMSICMFLFSLAAGKKNRTTNNAGIETACGIGHILNFALLLFTHFTLKKLFLYQNWHMLAVLVFGFLCFAFFLKRIMPNGVQSPKIAGIFGLISGGIIVFVLLTGVTIPLPSYPVLPLVLLTLLALLIFVVLHRFKWVHIPVFVVICALLFTIAAQTNQGSYRTNTSRALYKTMISHNTALFNFKNKHEISLGDITVSHLGGDMMNHFSNSFFELAGIRMRDWDKDAWNNSLELLRSAGAVSLREGYLVVFGDEAGDKSRAEEILVEAGMVPALELEHEAGTGEARIYMWVFGIAYENYQNREDAMVNQRMVYSGADSGFYPVTYEEEQYPFRWFLYRCVRKARKILKLSPPPPFMDFAPLRELDGHTQYVTISERDHLAGEWFPVEGNDTAVTLKIEYSRPFESSIVLQDEQYKSFRGIKLPGDRGLVIKTVNPPRDMQQFRISIQPRKITTLTLPDKIEVWTGPPLRTP